MLDAYFWLDREEAADLRAPLAGDREAAAAALAEFDKVAAIKRTTAAEAQRVTDKVAHAAACAADAGLR